MLVFVLHLILILSAFTSQIRNASRYRASPNKYSPKKEQPSTRDTLNSATLHSLYKTTLSIRDSSFDPELDRFASKYRDLLNKIRDIYAIDEAQCVSLIFLISVLDEIRSFSFKIINRRDLITREEQIHLSDIVVKFVDMRDNFALGISFLRIKQDGKDRDELFSLILAVYSILLPIYRPLLIKSRLIIHKSSSRPRFVRCGPKRISEVLVSASYYHKRKE